MRVLLVVIPAEAGIHAVWNARTPACAGVTLRVLVVVIPAEAGIHAVSIAWPPAFAGVTGGRIDPATHRGSPPRPGAPVG